MAKRQPFTAGQFTATQFDTAADKARFANHFVRFVDSGYKETLFYDWFYRRLSMTFGHIAHYNRAGFYYHFFQDKNAQLYFMTATRQGGGYGDPAYTYSDVEKAIKAHYGMVGDGRPHLGW